MRAEIRAIARARSLRASMTGPERKLWSALRAHRLLGAHFRRQAPMDPYALDFYCHAVKLAIEIDGD
jgi:very-short-patch-repair endonuclease